MPSHHMNERRSSIDDTYGEDGEDESNDATEMTSFLLEPGHDDEEKQTASSKSRTKTRMLPGNGWFSVWTLIIWDHLSCWKSRHFSRFLRGLMLFMSGVATTILLFIINGPEFTQLDSMDRAFGPFDSRVSSSHFPSAYFQSVLPIPCHSHNDYWRRRPLWSALLTGCISVEADISLVNGETYVGHTKSEWRENRTLSNMYINPLADLLWQRKVASSLDSSIAAADRQSIPSMSPPGIFLQDPEQSTTLLVDFKTADSALWYALNEALEPLRRHDWLTFWDGRNRIERPITVVVSGSAPFDLVIANTTYRDVFYDAPLEALVAEGDYETEVRVRDVSRPGNHTMHHYKYDYSNSHYASSSMKRAFGLLWQLHFFSGSQLGVMRTQIEQARKRGLVPRYWGTPRWPRGYRDSVWEVLVSEGVGVLNVDDLRAARKGNWGPSALNQFRDGRVLQAGNTG